MGSLVGSWMGWNKKDKFPGGASASPRKPRGFLSCVTAPAVNEAEAVTAIPNTTHWAGAEFTLRAGGAEVVVPATESVFRSPTQLDATPAPEEVELSMVDTHFFVRRCQLPWALFFRSALDVLTLRQALAEVLLSNPVTAGRLRTTGGDPAAMPGGPECHMFVMCNNAGASFSVVESTATLQDLKIQADASNISSSSKSNDDLRRKVNDLPPYLEMLDMDAVLSGASPLLSVRLTLLADGGCILGATMPHVVVDGESMHSVLEALAAAYCKLAGGDAAAPPTPLHDRGAFLRVAPQNVEAWEPDPYFEKYGAARLGWKLALAVWRSNYGKPTHQVVTLSAEDLRAMKTHLTAQGGGAFLSTNDVIVAYVWALLRAVRERSSGSKAARFPPRIFQAVNMRGRVQGCEPRLFGNAAWVSLAEAEVDASPSTMAKQVRASVELFKDPAHMQEFAGRIRSIPATPPAEQTRHIMRPFVADGMMTSWAFPFLELDFGVAGKPFQFGGSIFPENCFVVVMHPAGSRRDAPQQSADTAGLYKAVGVNIGLTVPAKKVALLQAKAASLLEEMRGGGDAPLSAQP